MNNTQQISLVPVPPRLSMSDPVLISAPLPSQGHGKILHRLLVGVVLLHIFLSVGGFIYLYHSNRVLPLQLPSGEGKATVLPSEPSIKALARMVFEQRSHMSDQNSAGYLQLDINHSVRRSINYYGNRWLTILEPGDYYVYSRVTFAKGLARRPLVSRVELRKNVTGEETVVMQSYCYLDGNGGSASIPRLCTATQGEAITLERGDQLSVWVVDMSLVNYGKGATSFGMYKL